MNGTYPLAMYVELSDSTDAAKSDDVARWLRDTHLPDLAASGWVLEPGLPYRNAASSPRAGTGRFLTISPADRWDMDSIAEELQREWEPKWRQGGRVDARFQRLWGDLFRLCGPTMRPSTSPFVTARTGTAPVTGVLVLQSTCPPASEMPFNDWYNRRRVPEMVQAGPFHTAYRYAAANRVDGRRRFLQLFESDARNPAAEIERFLQDWRPLTPVPPFLEELGTSVFTPA